MKTIKSRLLLSFLSIILVLGISKTVMVYYIVEKDIIERAQKEVKVRLNTARAVYIRDLDTYRTEFTLISDRDNPDIIKEKLELDYLYIVKPDKNNIRSDIVREALRQNRGLGGIRIIPKEELLEMHDDLYEKIKIEVKDTEQARPGTLKVLESAMAVEYALPVNETSGKTAYIIYGGRVINNNNGIVDRARSLVFEQELYNEKPTGTVTIFQDDIRIATNVLDKEGKRAIGTRVSEAVYKKVVEEGRIWVARAFVVTDWYLTAYEPIKDINGHVIGILYVGMLEAPFRDMSRDILFGIITLIALATMIAAILSYILAESISKPIKDLLNATSKFAAGDLDYRVKTVTSIEELTQLDESFNKMAERLAGKRQKLEEGNEKLKELNKSYLDLIGFVAHELKGILASTILNAYTVRDGFLGLINFKQRKALDSITRNLDYLEATVKNFLNLSRIEKGEIKISKIDLLLKEDVFSVSVEAFSKQASEKGMEIIDNIDKGIKLKGDPDLLAIVANNLVGNAIKYGSKDGKIILTSSIKESKIEINVYNDGIPIKEEDKGKLFKKFSRLESQQKRKVRGTGLGLFVTKDIIEKHGGNIRVEQGDKGNSFIFTLERGC
ncbi:MAG: cache domain-containing protein [Candidatus Eremiobacterota bacterium]